MSERDTIYALASARGRSGIAVFRISGPRARDAGLAMAGEMPSSRCSRVVWLRDPINGIVLDQSLVITFQEGASYTSESVVEFHTHGSPAVINAVLAGLSKLDGLRLAEPGEFTRRALEGGNLDLARVEGLADLLEAETEAQRKQAVRVMRGAVAKLSARWRESLTKAMALIAVSIDFSDEEVPQNVSSEVLELIEEVMSDIKGEVEKGLSGERVRTGFEVAVVGRPNTGKSTLLNKIAGREVALTSEIAGTTRDVIELRLNLTGLPVTLLDTAGIHTAEDSLDAMGVDRAIDRAKAADMRVFLLEPQDRANEFPVPVRPGDVEVLTKSDLAITCLGPSVSGKTGAGIDDLLGCIGRELERRVDGNATMVTERQRQALTVALSDLAAAENHVCSGPADYDLASEDLRRATRALDVLVGRVGVEDILDRVFESFCLGK